MPNQSQKKLRENEKKILKLEEETLRKLISQYQSSINALKVEELTLINLSGKSQDRARQCQSRSSATSLVNSTKNSPIPPIIKDITQEQNIPAHPNNINKISLNLATMPVITLEEEIESDEDEEEE